MIIENLTNPGQDPVEGDYIRITHDDTVEERYYFEGFTNYIYMHITISGGDEKVPPGIENNGTDTLIFDCKFRTGESQESDVITDITGVNFRTPIRDDSGKIYDLRSIPIVNGAVKFEYKTSKGTGIFHIDESDFTHEVNLGDTNYSIRLANEIIFKVYDKVTVI